MRLRPKNRLSIEDVWSHKASVEILGIYGLLARAPPYGRIECECDRVMYPGAKYSMDVHVTSPQNRGEMEFCLFLVATSHWAPHRIRSADDYSAAAGCLSAGREAAAASEVLHFCIRKYPSTRKLSR